MSGLISMPWWGYVIVALVMTHITIASVTLYLHRHQAHRAMDLHPALSHFFRFWLWLTTGMVTREWVAVHRKHHAFVEAEGDPHSPVIFGINKVLLEGAELYRDGIKEPGTLDKYSHGTPDDWVERNMYGGENLFCRFGGVSSMLIINVLLFGPLGLTIWAVQMMWIPIFAAGVINGIGHHSGYRNFETADTSTNIVPWGILIGGEELHNNHHAFGSSAKFSSKPWEFDIGWMYIRILSALGLARVKKLAPEPAFDDDKQLIDLDTVGAVVSNRLHVMAAYARTVVNQVHSEEVKQAAGDKLAMIKPIRRLLAKDETMLDDSARAQIAAGLSCSDTLEVVYQFKLKLAEIWNERTASQERLLAALQEWCKAAEATGIRALEEFSQSLRGYTLQTAAR